MKLTKITAAALAVTVPLVLGACSKDAEKTESSTAKSQATTASADASSAVQQPTLEELNAVLARATDPNVPLEQKTQTVQGGETAPELFDVMAASQAESGAQFTVVDPILPGYTPDSYLANVTFTLPDREPQVAEGVEFIHEGGTWKLSQSWACTLVTNTVPPEEVPQLCQAQTPVAPAPEPEPAPAG
ncbi:hypothetical protein CATYP_07255 [Corynebacterium atypicum]|uniref:Low molecular weight antigen MTB12-like C-terminal domain-containing protein n=1 Tax=Corynebacterium atypicum TaxID=191610 RepID=A0ABM5QNU5_9CORY|nr:hypothetical protein [Corynebacterium atypicum]AIG64417.1 hypothetical protein CATYP_07255 [Corynebacterium atypicum]